MVFPTVLLAHDMHTNGCNPEGALYDSAEDCCDEWDYSRDYSDYEESDDSSWCMKRQANVCLPCTGQCNEAQVCEHEKCVAKPCDDESNS